MDANDLQKKPWDDDPWAYHIYSCGRSDQRRTDDAEIARLRARWENLCDGISYPTLDDERLRYVEVQIPREDWDEIKATKKRGEGE